VNALLADALIATTEVTIKAPARLHLGFLDLNATTGRRFGSIGLSIDSQYTALSVSRSDELKISGEAVSDELRKKVVHAIDTFYSTLGKAVPVQDRAVSINLHSLPPAHSGFGSGTQLSLAIGTALIRLHQLDIDTDTLAHAMKRGQRSGIGIATFQHGGFVIDGGVGPDGSVPPILTQQAYPDEWRIVLILDPDHQGMHGKPEKEAFQSLPEFALKDAERICHQTLMKLLPALHDENITDFGEAISEIQALIGDHFSPAQGGRYASPAVSDSLNYAQKLGYSGIAQSSWGPTGCIFVASQAEADKLTQQLQEVADSRLTFMTTAANNQGAEIELTRAA
jgi:beta-RFAP synthase